MALKRNERYPGRFNNPTTAHPQGAFKNRTAPSSKDGSYLEQDWANDWDGFFSSLLSAVGITPDGNVDAVGTSQYYDALLKVIKNNAGAPAIGIPFFWPSSAMPNLVMPEWSDMAFLKFNGASFSATAYPRLALAFPALLLPEARGEFPRIWDDGRGVDSGRTLLSAQGDTLQNVTGTIISRGYQQAETGSIAGATGVFAYSNQGGLPGFGMPGGTTSRNADVTTFDMSKVARTSSETRPRNIAFNFLVRAK